MSDRHAYLRRARHWIANRGWRGFLIELFWRARLRLKGEPVPGRPGPEKGPHPFDLAHNVDTTGLVWGESLATSEKGEIAKYWATGYYAVAPSSFEDALKRLALNWSSYTFIDIGCGKGRALLLALRHPFREAVGIALSPELASIARKNLRTMTGSLRIQTLNTRVITADATTFEFPGGALVIFLYHPFAAPVMRRFLDNLGRTLQAHPRPVYLLYTNPELAAMLDATPFLVKLWDAHFPMSRQDIAADRFGSMYERIIAYRTHDAETSTAA